MNPGTMQSIILIALRDLLFDWRLSLVALVGITVALAPLMILFGLKAGLIDTLREDLASHPSNLELVMLGGGAAGFDAGWFETVAAREETGFLMPMTRGTVARILLRNQENRQGEPIVVSLIPSGFGDPVMAKGNIEPPEGESIVLTVDGAETLNVKVGDQVQATITRSDGARIEPEFLDLEVSGVLPASLAGGDSGYVSLHLIIAVEDYREWQRVDRYGWPGDTALDDPFADFRLYARTIDDVEPLRKWLLSSKNIEVDSAADRIEVTRRINADLSLIFAAILVLTVSGYAATIALNQISTVDRKRKSLAILRLLGFRGTSLMLFPVVQGVCLAMLGTLAALLVYAVMNPVFGSMFGDVVKVRGSLMRLTGIDVAWIVTGSVLIAGGASLFAARQAARISPSRELRDV